MKKILTFICFLFVANYVLPTASCAAEKIKITIGGAEITATLHDNATARDLVSLLPLTLSFRDYAGAEKVARLPRNLDTSGAAPGYDPELSDIALFSGEIAVYYKDQPYYPGIVPIAKIDGNGIQKFAEQSGNFTATISKDGITPEPDPDPKPVSSGGGGCSVMFSPLGLILLLGVPLWISSNS